MGRAENVAWCSHKQWNDFSPFPPLSLSLSSFAHFYTSASAVVADVYFFQQQQQQH